METRPCDRGVKGLHYCLAALSQALLSFPKWACLPPLEKRPPGWLQFCCCPGDDSGLSPEEAPVIPGSPTWLTPPPGTATVGEGRGCQGDSGAPKGLWKGGLLVCIWLVRGRRAEGHFCFIGHPLILKTECFRR